MRLIRAVPLLFVFAACSEDSSPPTLTDAGPADTGAAADVCTGEMPCALMPGTPQLEFIAPAGDNDPYTFTVPTANEVINIIVDNDTNLATVAYEVVLFDPDGMSLVSESGAQGLQRIEIQRVAPVAGEYRVVVRATTTDSQDDRNPYRIQVGIFSQTDNNEPNETPAAATPLMVGVAASGTIGTQDDKDWFSVAVGADQLVEIEMSSPGTSPVQLRRVLFDPTGTEQIAEANEPAGSWPVEVRAVGNTAGTYLILIEDQEGDDADLNRVYTITVRLLNEPDAQDLAAPNEEPAAATALTAGQPVTGYIASTSDQDYYSIEVSGASSATPKLITVRATSVAASPVDLAFTVLDRTGNAVLCGDECANKAFRFQPNGEDGPANLVTAHPIFENGTYYVLVRDLSDDDADQATSYQLTVDVVDEPDSNENFGTGRSSAQIVPLATATTGETIEFVVAEGIISHANDEDWFRFDIPGTANPSMFSNGDWLVNIVLTIPNATPIETQAFFYGENRFYRGVGRQCIQVPGQNDQCQFPDAENAFVLDFGETAGTVGQGDGNNCLVVFREETDRGPHYWRITDLDRDDFDLNLRYQIRVTLTADCRTVAEGDAVNSVCTLPPNPATRRTLCERP